MRLLAVTIALGASAIPLNGEAADGGASSPLQLRPKAGVAALAAGPYASPTSPHSAAPFVLPSSEPELDLMPRRGRTQEASRSSCATSSTLCYEPDSGRIVYKPARQYMPDLPGLQRENISLKRDRITFRYSF
jgi:hypothetical protein